MYYDTKILKPKKMKNVVCLFDGTPFSEIFEVTKKVGALIQHNARNYLIAITRLELGPNRTLCEF